MRVYKPILFAAVAALIVLALFAVWPVSTQDLVSRPQPAPDFESAVTLANENRDADADSVLQVCDATLLTHGYPTERAFVLVHGYANCPNQFLPLAEQLFERGFNVYLPRLPGHGYTNRMTTAMSDVDAPSLARVGDRAVDVAAGLGERVTVVGLSAGGAVAAWAGSRRREVDRAVLLTPALGIRGVPEAGQGGAIRLLTGLPDRQIWWDPRVRENLPGPDLAYPRFSTHAIGECFRLGVAAREIPLDDPAAPAGLVLVLNPKDPSLHNGVSRSLAAAWERAGAPVVVRELPGEWNLPHDFVDPAQPGARVDLVYPLLLEVILGTAPAAGEPAGGRVGGAG